MKEPIIIDSKIEFVIVSPITHKDGIIVRSKILDIELIGFANHLYYKGNSRNYKELDVKLYNSDIEYIWSNNVQVGTPIRKAALLFCWKIPQDFKKKNSFVFNDENLLIINEFERFIENTSAELKEFTSSNYLKNTKEQNDKLLDIFTNIITWRIAPLLLQCLHKNIQL